MKLSHIITSILSLILIAQVQAATITTNTGVTLTADKADAMEVFDILKDSGAYSRITLDVDDIDGIKHYREIYRVRQNPSSMQSIHTLTVTFDDDFDTSDGEALIASQTAWYDEQTNAGNWTVSLPDDKSLPGVYELTHRGLVADTSDGRMDAVTTAHIHGNRSITAISTDDGLDAGAQQEALLDENIERVRAGVLDIAD